MTEPQEIGRKIGQKEEELMKVKEEKEVEAGKQPKTRTFQKFKKKRAQYKEQLAPGKSTPGSDSTPQRQRPRWRGDPETSATSATSARWRKDLTASPAVAASAETAEDGGTQSATAGKSTPGSASTSVAPQPSSPLVQAVSAGDKETKDEKTNDDKSANVKNKKTAADDKKEETAASAGDEETKDEKIGDDKKKDKADTSANVKKQEAADDDKKEETAAETAARLTKQAAESTSVIEKKEAESSDDKKKSKVAPSASSGANFDTTSATGELPLRTRIPSSRAFWRAKVIETRSPVPCSWISPDGKFVGYGGRDKLHVVDCSSWEEVQTFECEGWVLTSWISPDGKVLGYGGVDKKLHVVDCSSWEEVQTFECEDEVYTSWISPDGKVLGYGGADRKLHVVDCSSWEEVHTIECEDWVQTSWISPDGKVFGYGGNDRKLHVVDCSSWEEVQTFESECAVMTSWISPDGKVFGYCGFSKKLHVVDCSSWEEVHTIEIERDVLTAWISPDGKVLGYGGYDNKLHVVDCSSWEEVQIFECEDWVRTSWISPDGKVFGYGGDDKKLHVVDCSSWEEVQTFECEGVVLISWMSPDGKLLGYGGGDDRKLHVVDCSKWEEVRTFECEDEVYTSWISPDGKLLGYGGDNKLHVVDCSSWEEVNTFECECVVRTSWISPDGKVLGYGGDDKGLRVVDCSSWEEVHTFECEGWGVVLTSWISPDGKVLGYGGTDRKLHVVDCSSWEEVRTFECEDWVYTSWISPDGKVLGYGGDKKLHVVDCSSWEEVNTFEGIKFSWISPDGKVLGYGGDDKKLHVVDISAPITSRPLVCTLPFKLSKLKDADFLQWSDDWDVRDLWRPCRQSIIQVILQEGRSELAHALLNKYPCLAMESHFQPLCCATSHSNRALVLQILDIAAKSVSGLPFNLLLTTLQKFPDLAPHILEKIPIQKFCLKFRASKEVVRGRSSCTNSSWWKDFRDNKSGLDAECSVALWPGIANFDVLWAINKAPLAVFSTEVVDWGLQIHWQWARWVFLIRALLQTGLVLSLSWVALSSLHSSHWPSWTLRLFCLIRAVIWMRLVSFRRASLNMWHVVDVVVISSSLLISFFRAMLSPIFIGLSLFLGVLNLLQLLLISRATGYLVQTLQVIVVDMVPLMVIQFIIAVSFTLFFHVAVDDDDKPDLMQHVGSMIKIGVFAEDPPEPSAFDDGELNILGKNLYQTMVYSMHWFYIFLCNIVTLNAVIAVMGSSFEKVSETSREVVMKWWNNSVVEAFILLPDHLRKRIEAESMYLTKLTFKAKEIETRQWDGQVMAIKTTMKQNMSKVHKDIEKNIGKVVGKVDKVEADVARVREDVQADVARVQKDVDKIKTMMEKIARALSSPSSN